MLMQVCVLCVLCMGVVRQALCKPFPREIQVNLVMFEKTVEHHRFVNQLKVRRFPSPNICCLVNCYDLSFASLLSQYFRFARIVIILTG